MNKRRRLKKNLVVVLFCILSSISAFYLQRKQHFVNEYVDVSYNIVNTEIVNKASLVMVGDALMHMPVNNAMKTNNGYDYSRIFNKLKDRIGSFDLAYYNQETILGGTELGLSGYPQFNSPYEVGDAFVGVGFNLVSLATNHTMDNYYRTGGKTINNSVNYWKKHEDKVIAAGSYLSIEDRDKIVIKEINGIKYALLSYTENTNGISVPSGKSYLCNVFSKEKAKEDILKYRDKVDVLMVAMHWGSEYTNTPTSGELDKAKFLAGLGVDIIIGCHPHVMQPMDYIGNTLVIYSLGNFVSNQSGYNKQTGLMASCNLVKKTYHGKTTVTIEDAEAEFVYTNQNDKYTVYPYSELNNNILYNYKSYFETFKKIIHKYSDKVLVKNLEN